MGYFLRPFTLVCRSRVQGVQESGHGEGAADKRHALPCRIRRACGRDLAWRNIGIFGYAVVFPVTCLALSRAFGKAKVAFEDTSMPSSYKPKAGQPAIARSRLFTRSMNEGRAAGLIPGGCRETHPFREERARHRSGSQIIRRKGADGLDRLELRRRLLMAGPVLVALSMAGAFTVLGRLLGPRRGYNAGFIL